MISRTRSLRIREILAPIAEPAAAAATVGSTSCRRTSFCLAKRRVAVPVPKQADSLLVATVWWIGSPASRYAGREISPPPPPMESTNPARKTMGHTIRKVKGVSCTITVFIPFPGNLL